MLLRYYAIAMRPFVRPSGRCLSVTVAVLSKQLNISRKYTDAWYAMGSTCIFLMRIYAVHVMVDVSSTYIIVFTLFIVGLVKRRYTILDTYWSQYRLYSGESHIPKQIP